MAAIRPNPTLSEDLISEILVRVPVKSLVCFQSVSKTWLSLIKHPAFVKSQLRHAITTQPDQTLIKTRNFSLLRVDSHQIAADLKLPYPQGEYKSVRYTYFVGSANGIVCVGVEFDSSDIPRKTDIYLWNPAIRQSKLIPSSFNKFNNITHVETLGFGYDGVDHDFKVVRVVGPPFYYAVDAAEVYSANKNVWRNVPKPIDIPGRFAFEVCINGFLCCIGVSGMMAFDLNQEVMNCAIKLPVIDDAHTRHLLNCAIKLPVINDAHAHDDDNDDYGYANDETRIIEFNNSVAVIMLMGLDKKINMWTLDDDECLRGGGVEASWTPMFSIDLGRPKELIHGYFSNGNLLLVLLINDVKMWISFNTDKKEAKIVPLSVDMAEHRYDCEIYKYTESLVSLEGFRHVN